MYGIIYLQILLNLVRYLHSKESWWTLICVYFVISFLQFYVSSAF